MRYKKQEQDALASLNTAFLKIHNNLHKYKNDIPFEAWAKRICINSIIDEYRKDKKYKAHIQYPDPDSQALNKSISWNEADTQFDADEILALINELPPMTRTVFNLFAIDGYSHKEIAAQFKISVGTSKWHLSTARKMLKAKIRAEKAIQESE